MLQFECSPDVNQAIADLEKESGFDQREMVGQIVEQVIAKPFFQIPKGHAESYQGDREQSQLGRVFSLANQSRDHLDALLVIGSDDVLAGIQALIAARCHPFHNETDRALRGSKPRIYFLSETSDNDTVAATMDRLTNPMLTKLQRTFATIVIAGGKEPARLLQLAERMMSISQDAAFQDNTTSPPDAERRPPFVWVGNPRLDLDESLRNRLTHWFERDNGVTGSQTLLTAAGLLPLAFLGLNCIKLVEGALAVCTSFAETPMEHWITLHAKILMAQSQQQRTVLVRREALQPIAAWGSRVIGRPLDSVLVLPRDRDLQDPTIGPESIGREPERWRHTLDVIGHRNDQVVLADGTAWGPATPPPSDAIEKSHRATGITLPALQVESLGRLVQSTLIVSSLQPILSSFLRPLSTKS